MSGFQAQTNDDGEKLAEKEDNERRVEELQYAAVFLLLRMIWKSSTDENEHVTESDCGDAQ